MSAKTLLGLLAAVLLASGAAMAPSHTGAEATDATQDQPGNGTTTTTAAGGGLPLLPVLVIGGVVVLVLVAVLAMRPERP